MSKKRNQPFFYIAVIVVIGLAGILFLKKESATADSATTTSPQAPDIILSPTFTETTPQPPPQNPSAAEAVQNKPAPIFSAADWDVVMKCVEASDFKKYFSNGFLELNQWINSDSRGQKTVDEVLIHYVNGGVPYRLRVSPSQRGEAKEPPRLFKVDTDGLPTPIDLPTQWKNMSDNSILSMIRQTYPVGRTIESGRWNIPGEMTMDYTLENQQITQFQMQWMAAGKAAAIACDQAAQKIKCQCN